MLKRFVCWWHGSHRRAVRQPIGGYKCADCDFVGADLEEMGFGSGYVQIVHRTYSRENGGTFERGQLFHD